MRKKLRKWGKKGGEGKEYKEKRLEYRKLCDRKKKEENDRWERKTEVRRESEI